MVAERLENKIERINQSREDNISNWEESFYSLLLRNFENPVNSDFFERLTKTLPFKLINKHRSDVMQLQALLMGQAGFLEKEWKDEYAHNLKKEFEYLKHKLNLIPMSAHEWKFMRIRPPHFPTSRLARIAEILHTYPHLFRENDGSGDH